MLKSNRSPSARTRRVAWVPPGRGLAFVLCALLTTMNVGLLDRCGQGNVVLGCMGTVATSRQTTRQIQIQKPPSFFWQAPELGGPMRSEAEVA